MLLLFLGAKLVQKLVLKKYVFVNLFIKFFEGEEKGDFLFATYSAAPARRLSFAYPSLILRSSFAVSISEVRRKWGGFFFFRIDKFAN